MAKKKKSRGLIPKKIAGVKVPKAARKGRFGQLLASRQGQALIAEALLGAGAIAAGMKAKNNPKVQKFANDSKHQVADASKDAAHGAAEAGSTLAYALGEAARTFAEALRHGERRSFAPADDAETVWTPDYGAPEPDERPAQASRKQPTAQGAGPR